MDDSAEDAFEDSLLSLFAHHPVAFSTPSPAVPWIYHPPLPAGSPAPRPRPIALHLPSAPSALHTSLQLTHIWLSSILLADLVCTREIDVRGQSVAELGAGAGLPGVIAVLGGAGYVVGTDYDVRAEARVNGLQEEGESESKDVLDVLRDNYQAATDGTDKREGEAWSVMGHTWATSVELLLRVLPPLSLSGGDTKDTSAPRRFSTLLLADLLWSSSSHSALITSIRALLAPSPHPSSTAGPDTPTASAHIAAGLHHGRHAVARFQAEWTARGGWVRERREVRWVWSEREKGESSWEEVRRAGERGAEDDAERDRGVVVWFEIGMDTVEER